LGLDPLIDLVVSGSVAMWQSLWFISLLLTLCSATRLPTLKARGLINGRATKAVNNTAGADISYVANKDRSDAVREAFRFAWTGYKKYAFPHDELHPVSNGYGDTR
jgi:hypothetical protein